MRALPLLLCLSVLLHADDEQVRKLIADLGADDCARRETAQRQLEEVGLADETGTVERLVQESCASENMEIATRCAGVLECLLFQERTILLMGDQAEGRTTGAYHLGLKQFLWQRPVVEQCWLGPRSRSIRAFLFEKGLLQSVDLRTGKLCWERMTPEHGVCVADSYWLGFHEDSACRVDLLTGEVAWSAKLPASIRGWHNAVAADGSSIVAATTDGLMAIDADSGAVRWIRSGSRFDSALPTHDSVFAWASVEGKSSARRLDRATGKDIWIRDIPNDEIAGYTRVSGPGNEVVVICGLGIQTTPWTRAYDAASGELLWSLDDAAWGEWSSPDGSRIWLASHRAIHVLDPRSGKHLSEIDIATNLSETHFTRDGDQVLATSYDLRGWDAEVRSFNIADGHPKWTTRLDGMKTPRHQDFVQNLRTERLPCGVVVIGETRDGTFIDILSPAEGKVLHHESQPMK